MMNTNDAVSLDFWNGLAFYSGKSLPCGTIGCDALNIPTEVIEKLKELCTVQYALINALTFGPGNPALLSAARESAQQIAKLLENGTDAVLIGETLMRSENKKQALDELRGM